MDMTLESCRRFVEVLASDAPAPGGGGAAALVGAIGTALGNMVGSLTVGKKKYADVQDEILALKAKCDDLQKQLLDQVEADDKGFVPLAKAYGIPKDDPNRDKILEEPSPPARCPCTSWSCAARRWTALPCLPRKAPGWQSPTPDAPPCAARQPCRPRL